MGYLGQQTVMGRVEVRDADTDAYIKGATVVVITSRGSITKETDIGGNAVFTLPEEVTIGRNVVVHPFSVATAFGKRKRVASGMDVGKSMR